MKRYENYSGKRNKYGQNHKIDEIKEHYFSTNMMKRLSIKMRLQQTQQKSKLSCLSS